MNNNININRLNYEIYVIDYIDGNLDAVETACLIAFLENNPDIKEEITELNSIKLIPEIGEFSQKSTLRKESVFSVKGISEFNYEEYFIANYEGDLSESKKIHLQQFLDKNPNLVTEFKLYKSLKIVPNSDVVFKDKGSLRHKKNIVPLWFSAAAAILILFAAYWFLFNQQSHTLRDEFSVVNRIIPKQTIFSISSTTVAKIEFADRQIFVVQPTSNIVISKNNNKIYITPIVVKTYNEQLVNTYDFARLVKRIEINSTPSYSENTQMMASTEPIIKSQRKSLIARVFSSQAEKITKGIKFRRTNDKELKDPTYVQVIDKGLLVFNTITGSDKSSMKIYNGQGDLTSYQIEGKEVMMGRHSSGKSSQ